MGLRRLLTRQPAAGRPIEPLARLAELGRAEDPHEREGDRLSSRATPTRLVAQPTREALAAPLSPVGVEKKSARILGRQQKGEPLDPRSWAAWKRQQSSGIEGLFDRKF
jgi:hypothetical protein